MTQRTRLALALVVSLGTAAFIPDSAGAFAVEHGANFARGVAPSTPQSRLSTSTFARARCHSVQVGDPRKQPPMLVCP
jgi:hypothetical protein